MIDKCRKCKNPLVVKGIVGELVERGSHAPAALVLGCEVCGIVISKRLLFLPINAREKVKFDYHSSTEILETALTKVGEEIVDEEISACQGCGEVLKEGEKCPSCFPFSDDEESESDEMSNEGEKEDVVMNELEDFLLEYGDKWFTINEFLEDYKDAFSYQRCYVILNRSQKFDRKSVQGSIHYKTGRREEEEKEEEEKEEEEEIQCEICKKSFKAITGRHLKSSHGISVEEYRKRFPEAQVHSDTQLQKWHGGLTLESNHRQLILKTILSEHPQTDFTATDISIHVGLMPGGLHQYLNLFTSMGILERVSINARRATKNRYRFCWNPTQNTSLQRLLDEGYFDEDRLKDEINTYEENDEEIEEEREDEGEEEREKEEEGIQCEICKKNFKAITGRHLKKSHKIKLREYKKRFPDAQIYSDAQLREWRHDKKEQEVEDGKEQEEEEVIETNHLPEKPTKVSTEGILQFCESWKDMREIQVHFKGLAKPASVSKRMSRLFLKKAVLKRGIQGSHEFKANPDYAKKKFSENDVLNVMSTRNWMRPTEIADKCGCFYDNVASFLRLNERLFEYTYRGGKIHYRLKDKREVDFKDKNEFDGKVFENLQILCKGECWANVSEISNSLNVHHIKTFHALKRLIAEGRVEREDNEYRPRPLPKILRAPIVPRASENEWGDADPKEARMKRG